MLEKIDLTKKLEKQSYREKMEALELELGRLQRECHAYKIPVMIVLEGFGASGKGVQIGKLIQALDPRGFRVHAITGETEEEQKYPFLRRFWIKTPENGKIAIYDTSWYRRVLARGFRVHAITGETEEEQKYPFLRRFWIKTPENGKIAIYDTSWYRRVLADRFSGNTEKEELEDSYAAICSFEEQLTAGGTVMIKLFLAIDQKEQKKRFEKLLESKETAWRVSREDWEKNEKYDSYVRMIEEALQRTDTDYAPWTIVEATDRRFATVKIYTTVIEALKEADSYVRMIEEALQRTDTDYAPWTIVEATDRRFATVKIYTTVIEALKEAVAEKKAEAGREISQETEETETWENRELEESVLAKVDLTKSYTEKEYHKKKKKLQKKIRKLHGELYRRQIPVIIGFEGWDAGGKGGAIKRLTEKMDPRGFTVNTTAAPNDYEKAHHYLWRFWKNVPKKGHVAVYDRTWYGRVMVERIEGFCTKKEWQRAFKEINDMEAQFVQSGAIVLKFWMQIDKEEQRKRFEERQKNPEKQWKITEEDWRNRDKWDAYEEAVNEMLIRTSTPEAPWVIVEGNCKYYARIKVLEAVIEAIEKRLESR